jgi:hypothetical protein
VNLFVWTIFLSTLIVLRITLAKNKTTNFENLKALRFFKYIIRINNVFLNQFLYSVYNQQLI